MYHIIWMCCFFVWANVWALEGTCSFQGLEVPWWTCYWNGNASKIWWDALQKEITCGNCDGWTPGPWSRVFLDFCWADEARAKKPWDRWDLDGFQLDLSMDFRWFDHEKCWAFSSEEWISYCVMWPSRIANLTSLTSECESWRFRALSSGCHQA